MKIGCHVSIAGGIENAPENAKQLGAECFQIFSRSPHGGKTREIDQTITTDFLKQCEKFNFEPRKDYVIHTPYFINLASTNNRINYGSISAIKKELEVATLLKAPYVITHIGSSKDLSGDDVQKQVNKKVIKALEKVYENYTGTAQLLLEIAAGSGNIIGDSFEEIAFFIKQMKKKSIDLGFCFDTCHSFAAGYDLREPESVRKVFDRMDKTIGLEQLKCIHFNDSQGKLGSHIDRHEHIGKGKIGHVGLAEVAKKAKEFDIHLYLETKHDKIVEDLKITKNMLQK